MEKGYRLLSGNKGIYEAVENDCPKDDLRRENKPDGSWVNRVGQNYPGAISFWTHKGWKKYESSGLKDWHKSVVTEPVKTLIMEIELSDILYQDEYQIIVPEGILD